MAWHSPQPCSHLSVRHRCSVAVYGGCQGWLGCQGYPKGRAGLGFRTQSGTCWTQQSTQEGLLTAKNLLNSEMVPPFLQNALYLEALSALKLLLAGLGLRAGWDAGHTWMQDAPRWRLRLQELLAPHTPSPARREEGEYRNQCSTLSLG